MITPTPQLETPLAHILAAFAGVLMCVVCVVLFYLCMYVLVRVVSSAYHTAKYNLILRRAKKLRDKLNNNERNGKDGQQ